MEVAKKYQFTILNIDKATHKIALSLKAANKAAGKTEVAEKKETKKALKVEPEATEIAETTEA